MLDLIELDKEIDASETIQVLERFFGRNAEALSKTPDTGIRVWNLILGHIAKVINFLFEISSAYKDAETACSESEIKENTIAGFAEYALPLKFGQFSAGDSVKNRF